MDGRTCSEYPQAPWRLGFAVPRHVLRSGMALERVILERRQVAFHTRDFAGMRFGVSRMGLTLLFLRNYKNDGSLFGYNLPIFTTLPSRSVRERHGLRNSRCRP